MAEKSSARRDSGSTHSKASIVKSIASTGQERKSLEWVEDLVEAEKKHEGKSDFTSDTWAQIIASELTMADVDEKIQEVEELLFGKPKYKTSREKKPERKSKEVEETVEEEEEEEEDGHEPRYFTFDLGRLDHHVAEMIRLLDSVSYPAIKPMPDLAGAKSLHTSTKDNINRLGLQVILNRVAVAFEYKIIKPNKEFPAPSIKVNITSEAKSNIWDRLKSMRISDALRTLAQRTDGVFGKELGAISGSLLHYPKHAILMLEGPEISLVDFFTQLYKSNIMPRIVKGKVLFIMPHVLIRYLDEWSEMEAIPPELEGELSIKDQAGAKQVLKLFGNKCADFWKYLRKNKLTGVGRTCEGVPDNILPEETLINFALESDHLRSLQLWLQELTTLDFQEDPAEESWPENTWTLPDSSFKPDDYTESLGITVKSTKPLPNFTPEMDKFLTANKKLYEAEEPEQQAKKEETKESTVKRKDSSKLQEAEKVLKAKSVQWKSKKKKQAK